MFNFKFKLQKKHLAFFTIVPLLASTAFIQVPCPVCDGSGHVSSTGMTDVTVSDTRVTELTRFMAGCDSYRVYQYEITTVLENHNDYQEAAGYISFVLTNSSTAQILDTQYGVAVVPAHTTVESTFTAYFQIVATVDMPNTTSVGVKLMDGNVPDKACGGTGKVALNSYLLTLNLKDNYIETQRMARPFIPPLWVESEGQAGIDY
jgi:hypothetical protein